jgi:hypothetical protein
VYKIDAEAGRVAFHIIMDHPLGYLQLVLHEYIAMFSPLEIWSNPLYSYQADPSVAYNYWDSGREGTRPKFPSLYPGKGLPDGVNSNQCVAAALGAIHDNPISQVFLSNFYRCEPWFSHLTFVFTVFLFAQAPLYAERFNHLVRVRRVALTLAMLFLTAAANALLVALCQVAKLRYQLAGDMPLHLMFLIAVFGSAPLLVPKILTLPVFDWFGKHQCKLVLKRLFISSATNRK